VEKNFVIIGGSKGIGLALVKQLIGQPEHKVWVFSRTKGNLPDSKQIIHQTLDILKEELPVDQLPAQIDGLAYCPGSITLKPFRSLKTTDLQDDFAINVLGAVKSIQACLKGLKKSADASVVLFSTVAVKQGMAFHASIATAKAGVEGLTKSLAAELAPRIRVNCIAPSLTNTILAEKLLSSPEKKEASDKRHPLRRVGEAEDIAAMAAFLLSDQGSWLSGQIIGVDGGLSTLRV
jgi:NAD(P)-dependent dehydrogenase (short-subunit alcohol dehydrogenase family)